MLQELKLYGEIADLEKEYDMTQNEEIAEQLKLLKQDYDYHYKLIIKMIEKNSKISSKSTIGNGHNCFYNNKGYHIGVRHFTFTFVLLSFQSCVFVPGLNCTYFLSHLSLKFTDNTRSPYNDRNTTEVIMAGTARRFIGILCVSAPVAYGYNVYRQTQEYSGSSSAGPTLTTTVQAAAKPNIPGI